MQFTNVIESYHDKEENISCFCLMKSNKNNELCLKAKTALIELIILQKKQSKVNANINYKCLALLAPKRTR